MTAEALVVTDKTSIRLLLTQISSAIVVVVSLVFVGLEVRESSRQTALNTQSLQVGAYQDLMAQIMALNMLGMESPGASAPLSESSLANLSPPEREREINRNLFIFRYGDLAYYQYELGMLSEERLESALGILRSGICSPLLRESWLMFRENFVPSYRDFMDERIAARADC
jgi:hypothetical protein